MKTHKRLLIPDMLIPHVSEISPALLAERHGIRAVICDLDNTLAEWRSEQIAEEVTWWLEQMTKAGMKICIASNTHNMGRLKRVATQLNIKHVPSNAGKPGTAGLKRALSLMEAHPGEAAMVGDQLFTDIVAGNRLGLMTILVNPLSPREFLGTRLITRTMERFILHGPLERPM